MSEFEAVLQACLDAIAAGESDVEQCLRRHPQHAAALRPHLLAAASLRGAYHVEPSEEFVSASRERFLIATGQRLREAFDNDPSPSFFAAARVKFLMTAHRMRLGERVSRTRRAPRRVPVFGTRFRALASGFAAIALFMSLSTYTVASASDALPGDWQYGVKLQTERVRLALAFSDGAERNIRLDIAQERAQEIEQLAAKGKTIGPDVLQRLKDQTAPLVQAANEGKLDDGEVERLHEVTARQRTLLADIEEQVAPEAVDTFAEAKVVSEEGYRTTFVQIADPNDNVPVVLTPDQLLEMETPAPTDTPEATETPPASATPGAATPTAPATTEPGETPEVGVGSAPEDTVFGVMWVRLSSGRFTTLIPSEKDGWRLMGLNTTLIQLSNADGTSLITINPRNGDMYWFILRNGFFDEIQMRLTRDGRTLIIDRPALREAYGDAAEIPIYMMNHIELVDPVTPTAVPATPAP